MDPTRRRLLDAVLADPDDEMPRRVLADWLCERDDPRGELISVQCERSAVPPTQTSRLDALEARENVLLAEHGPTWLADAGLHAHEATFVRGFIDFARLRGERVAEAADQLAAREPVRSLQVQYLGEEGLLDLLRRPLVHLLSTLHADNNQLGQATARALGASRPRRLRHLNLRSNQLGDSGVSSLVTSGCLAGLRSLDLGSNRLTSFAATSLAECRHLVILERLELERNPIDDDGAFALASSPHLKRIVRLNLSRDRLSSEAQSTLKARFGEAWVS